jgi:pilus assembly protein CpaB
LITYALYIPEEPSTASSLSGLTPQGTRAVTIIVDAITGVGGFVRPGDKVDILWTFQLPQGGQAQPVTLTLFQEIPVLAIGRTMAGQGGDEGGAEEAAQQHVTLALVPQETSLLLFARENGKIQLALRPRLESGVVAVPPASIDRLMERALGISPDAQAPPARHVDVYRGLQHNRVVLSDKEQ